MHFHHRMCFFPNKFQDGYLKLGAKVDFLFEMTNSVGKYILFM